MADAPLLVRTAARTARRTVGSADRHPGAPAVQQQPTAGPSDAGGPARSAGSCGEAYTAPAPTPDRSPRHTIGEVAATSGLTAHTLRWYEQIGLLEPIDRSYSGQRRYSDGDLARLAFLGKLRLTGMPVADMLRYVELVRAGEQTYQERRDLLVAHRAQVRQRIIDLQTTLLILDHKIDLYSGVDSGRLEGNQPT